MVRNRLMKFNPKVVTSYRAHGKWGDFIICLLPISWCVNILSNSNFIMRMLEWQTESNLFTVRIRGKQWYWIYKIEIKTLLNVNQIPKNLGHNHWVTFNNSNLNVSEHYINLIQLKYNNIWLSDYISDVLLKSGSLAKTQSNNSYLSNSILDSVKIENKYSLSSIAFNWFNKANLLKSFQTKMFLLFSDESKLRVIDEDKDKFHLNLYNDNFLPKKLFNFFNKQNNLSVSKTEKIQFAPTNMASKLYINANSFSIDSKNYMDIFVNNFLVKLYRIKFYKKFHTDYFSKPTVTKIDNLVIFDHSEFQSAWFALYHTLDKEEKNVFMWKFFFGDEKKFLHDTNSKFFRFLRNSSKINFKFNDNSSNSSGIYGILHKNFFNKNNDMAKINSIEKKYPIKLCKSKILNNSNEFKTFFSYRPFFNKTNFLNINSVNTIDSNRYLRNNWFTRINFLKINFLNNNFVVNTNYSNSKLISKNQPDNIYLVIKQKRYSPVRTLKMFNKNNTNFSFELKNSAFLKLKEQQTLALVNNNITVNFDASKLEKKEIPSYFFNKQKTKIIYRTRRKKISQFFNLNNRRLLRTKRILVLPSNINITLITNSFDVVHSWYVPGLGVKMDCIPGRSTHHTINIDHAGFYYGQCAEICGRFHHHMPIRVCALPFEHFLIWWYHYGLPYFNAVNTKRTSTIKSGMRKYNW